MKQSKISILALALSLFSLLSCNHNMNELQLQENEISLTSHIIPTTRGTDLSQQSTLIVEGQQVSVTITNAQTTHNNVAWTVDKNGALINSSNPIYWGNEDITIVAYHPFNENWTDTDHVFTINTDQSTDKGYLNSDLLWAKTTASVTDAPIGLDFTHKLAKINVTLSSDDTSDLSNATIYICGTKTSIEFNPVIGTLGKASSIHDIKASVTSENAYTASAIIIPQTVVKDAQLIKITQNEKNFFYSLPEEMTFESGHSYHYQLKVNGTNIENPTESLVIKGWKEDNPTIYANGGETTLSITSQTPWKAIVLDAAAEEWLELETSNNSQGTGTLLIRTSANPAFSDRTAEIKIQNETDSECIQIVQLQNILTRSPQKERKVSNILTWTYDEMNLTKLVAILPVPGSNLYQDISQWSTDGGELLTAEGHQYLRKTLVKGEFPASGKSIMNESFIIKNYHIYTNFNAITRQIPTDEESDIYTRYTRQNGDIIVPEHSQIQEIADRLWKESSSDIIRYVRECYEYVASNMKYLNSNTGLHPLDKVLSDGGGDCGNQASVFISLLRNKKIPARHVVMIRTDGTYHVRSEFHLAGYGWIPVDVNAKNMNPSGDYFGKVESDEIVVSNDVNIKVEVSDKNIYTARLLQTYLTWYWWTSPVTLNFNHKVIEY